jgi:hypothetical protein
MLVCGVDPGVSGAGANPPRSDHPTRIAIGAWRLHRVCVEFEGDQRQSATNRTRRGAAFAFFRVRELS